MEPEYPFEWGGLFKFKKGYYNFTLNQGPDPAMNINLRKTNESTDSGINETIEKAVLAFSDNPINLESGAIIEPCEDLISIELQQKKNEYVLKIPSDGSYVLYTEHHPDEFASNFTDASENKVDPLVTREFKPDHEHDEDVTSVGINTPGDLDLEKFQKWLSDLLKNKGQDIFRMKGVLSFADSGNRYVFQGVHMLFDGQEDRPWKEGERSNSLIFIGRNLDRKTLNEGFRLCLT